MFVVFPCGNIKVGDGFSVKNNLSECTTYFGQEMLDSRNKKIHTYKN